MHTGLHLRPQGAAGVPMERFVVLSSLMRSGYLVTRCGLDLRLGSEWFSVL
jgi:hypothetical protein